MHQPQYRAMGGRGKAVDDLYRWTFKYPLVMLGLRDTKPQDPWFEPAILRFRVRRARFYQYGGDLAFDWVEEAVRKAGGLAYGQPRVIKASMRATDGLLAILCPPQCQDIVVRAVIELKDFRGRPVGAQALDIPSHRLQGLRALLRRPGGPGSPSRLAAAMARSKGDSGEVDLDDSDMCTICQGSDERSPPTERCVRCQATYHADCIQQWLAMPTSDVKCPVCSVPWDNGTRT